MRTAALLAIILCLYLHFSSRPEVVEEDQLQTRQSALAAAAVLPKPALPKAPEAIAAPVETEAESIVAEDEEDTLAENDIEEAPESLPWPDIEEGWKTELKNYLTEADPENGETVFNAYLEEKRKFAEQIDFTDRSHVINEDGESRGPAVVEYDGRAEEAEQVHQDNLRDIFGPHYQQIKALHQEYVESIQHLNSSEVKFSISL